MTIGNLLTTINVDHDIAQTPVTGISDDSRTVQPGDIFFVLPRPHFDIFSILTEINSRVSAFVVAYEHHHKMSTLRIDKPVVVVDSDIIEIFRAAVKTLYVRQQDVSFIGVTGTNGKSTVSQLLYQCLRSLDANAALVGTLGYHVNGSVLPAPYTTPDFLTTYKVVNQMPPGAGYVVMEVSSHGIDQGRVATIPFCSCVFTNLSRDHLDYHHDMEQYFAVKKRLFINNPQAQAIINCDDPYGQRLISDCQRSITYGVDGAAHLRAQEIVYDKYGTSFKLMLSGQSYPVHTQLIGKINVYNVLAVIAVLRQLGYAATAVVEVIKTLAPVLGRMQQVHDNIFIDYAHTPDALSKSLGTLRSVGYKHIICVFGCGGDRDRGKRKMMGEIAAGQADFSIITSDNPRSEDPYAICREIQKGFNHTNYTLIVDRKEAIKEALQRLQEIEEGCVLIAGKGHEDYQIIGKQRLAFCDEQVVDQMLALRSGHD